MLEENAMHLGTEADISAHVLDINGRKNPIERTTGYGRCLERHTIRNMEKDGI